MIALWIPAALGVVTTLALNTRLLPYGPQTFASASAALPGVVVVATVTLLVDLARRRMPWAIAALAVVTAADLGAWGIRFIYREPAQTIQKLTSDIPAPPDGITYSYAAAPSRGPYHGNLLVMRGYRLTSGYAGLYPATRHPLESEPALRLAGTRWLFTPDGVRHPVDGGEPRLRLLDEQEQPSTGSAQLILDRPGRLVVQTELPGRRILAFTERFHPGWSATTDGSPAQMVRVEGDFLGCLVESGVRRVELRFMPRSFVYGALLSAVGAALLAGILIARLR